MVKCFLLLLLVPLLGMSQTDETMEAFEKSIPAGLGMRIHIPQRHYNSNYAIEDSVSYKQKVRVFVIQTENIYRKLFSQYIYTKDSLSKNKNSHDSYSENRKVHYQRDSIPPIDFSKNELVLYSACAQCLSVCEHDKASSSCHRNVCIFTDAWFVRERSLPDSMKSNSGQLPAGRNCRRLSLPVLQRSELEKVHTLKKQSTGHYIISSDSAYQRLFARYTKEELPFVDFRSQELWVKVDCIFCLRTGADLSVPRHRNACSYKDIWCISWKEIILK